MDGDTVDEIIVTTTNGELIVLQWDIASSTATPIFHHKVEGALGMFYSIVIADLDPVAAPDGIKEVYIAGTQGIRRFDIVPGQ